MLNVKGQGLYFKMKSVILVLAGQGVSREMERKKMNGTKKEAKPCIVKTVKCIMNREKGKWKVVVEEEVGKKEK